jgi:hypothetical protein
MNRIPAAGLAAGLVLALAPHGRAHEGITAKFTYNEDVYPVFLNRCGRCHVDGGIGPMSLLKYEDAFPWAESLRAELLTAYGDMRPEAGGAPVDPHDFVKAAHRQISARELDIVLDWASGGTPEGDRARVPEAPAIHADWAAGPPDVIAQMPDPYDMKLTDLEATHEAALPIPTRSAVTVARVDLLPGNPAIVRSAVLSLQLPDGTSRVLGTWVPRQVPAPIVLRPAALVEPGSQVVARLQYKKTWKYEGQAMSDRSTVGLYLAE